MSLQLLVLDIDPRLANIWSDLDLFCTSANLAFHTSQKMKPEMFQNMLISIGYRLTLLELRAGDLNELFRLGLLAFSTTVFLQTQAIKMRFGHLSRQFRDALLKTDWADGSVTALRLWLLFVAGLSAATRDDDHWLLPLLFAALHDAQFTSWESVRAVLKGFLWVDALHDVEGEKIFHQVVNDR